jgi:H+/Na+-translocating ferredoxin:NAD+ oxidoreductase subunit G
VTAAAVPAYRNRVAFQGVLLGGFASLAAALLIMGNFTTFDTIGQRKAEDLQRSLSQVIPDNIHDNNLLDDQMVLHQQGGDITVYRGLQMLKPTAVAFILSTSGFSGEISLVMGINRSGEVLGVRVLSHSETPGLGDKIEVEKNDWINGFNGLSYVKLPQEQWHVKKDGGAFDQFSGATITPRAVVKAIREGMDLFQANRDTLLGEKSGASPALSSSTHVTAATNNPTAVNASAQVN